MQLKIGVFAYNFPHKKTQDFLFRLFVEGFRIQMVLACDPVTLNTPPAAIRTKVRHEGLVDPRQIAERIGVPWHVVAHDGETILELLRGATLDLGIVAGARILKQNVIGCFRIGIINFHPGLIPEARGLDAMLWSIHRDQPLGVTAHLIDHRVDAGRVLIRKRIAIHGDDTALDFSERLYETQLDLLRPSIDKAAEVAAGTFDPEIVGGGTYNRKMPADLEAAVMEKLPLYVRNLAITSRHSDSS